MKARLSNEVIAKIRYRMKETKHRHIWTDINMLIGLSTTSTRLYGVLDANKWNGILTGEAVLQYLENEFGMTRSNLLEIVDE